MKEAGRRWGFLAYCRHCQQRETKAVTSASMSAHQQMRAMPCSVFGAGLWPPKAPTCSATKKKAFQVWPGCGPPRGTTTTQRASRVPSSATAVSSGHPSIAR